MKKLKLFVSLLLGFAVLGLLWSASRLTVAAAQDVQFNRDIRPLLSGSCFYCHGPDEKNRKAGLRLDTFEGATKDRGGYLAITPGKPDESELLRRVTSHEAGEMMPPPSAKKAPITPAEAELLRRWIAQGAKYEGHWAFQPLAQLQPPAVKDTKWVRNGIDNFILARLEREGLAPSPQADARTLIRRLSLDLTGLLPQPAEVEAFVKAFSLGSKNQDAAYSALVERLLSSPHYGERWGRHWLDQARYADSNGYTIDGERVMWPYRDWVIQAFNEDKPFDRFTIEQLAGDLLPEPTKSQLVATGFHRNTVINEEGGVDPEQARVEQVMDRVSTTGAVWLGLTVGCAQCHTHKFDPITHKEYYQLLAFFNSTIDVNNQGPTVTVTRGEMFGQPETNAAPTEAPLARRGMPLGELKQGEWERTEIARLERNPAVTAPKKGVEWVSFEPVKFDTEAAGKLQRLNDGSFLITANASANDAYRILVKLASPRVAAVRLRVLPHEALPKNGPGLAADGSFALSEFYIDSEGGQHRFNEAFADDEQLAYPARTAADGDRRTGWSINNNATHEAVFVYAKPKEFASRQIQFILRHEAETGRGIGHFAIEIATETPHDARGAALLEALKLPLNARSPEQQIMVDAAFASARAVREKQAGNAVMAMIMRDTNVPRESYIFKRGDFTRPDIAVGLLQPNVISAVAPALPETGKPRTRLDLAKWLVDPSNPLTPRVTMNRVWMRYFGRGIVETEEDFGTQGSRPTHPELLNWLAITFRDGTMNEERGTMNVKPKGEKDIQRSSLRVHPWSMKDMHRLIVTSATYRQSSSTHRSSLSDPTSDVDPRNLLLARQERFRVEAEIVRDVALSASGLLNPKIGGPSVRPPQPDGVYAFTQNRKNWTTAAGAERFRRALYTHFYRSAPYPLFTTFDSPDFQQVCTRRQRSNTPLQSLTLANDPAFLEIAQGLAARLVREVPGEFAATLDARLRHAFALCFSRPPSVTELAALRNYVERQAQGFTTQPASATALVNKELTKAGLTEAQSAALTAAARVLFNTDNFITRE